MLAASLGFDRADAAALVARWPDGARRARVMAANVEALRAAGYRFEPWPPRGFVVQGMRDDWPPLSAAEAAARVEARAARRAARARARPADAGGAFNVAPEAEVRRIVGETRRADELDREMERALDELTDEQWRALAAEVRRKWAELMPWRRLPDDVRGHAGFRALAKAHLAQLARGERAR